jgi:hypothetical protein
MLGSKILKSEISRVMILSVFLTVLTAGCSPAVPDGVSLYDLVMTVEQKLEDDNHEVLRFYDRDSGERIHVGDFVLGEKFVDAIPLTTIYREGLFAARKANDGKFGYVDSSGRIVIPLQYVAASAFNEGRAIVGVYDEQARMRWGVIDRRNRWIVPPDRYDELGKYKEGRCGFRVGEKWGLLDIDGKVVVSPRFNHELVFHKGHAVVIDADKHPVYIDRYGRVKFKAPELAVWAGNFHNGVAWYGIMPLPEDLDDPRSSHPRSSAAFDYYPTPIGDRYGLISIVGKVVMTPVVYGKIGEFSEGLAAVSPDAKFSCSVYPDLQTRGEHAPSSWGYVDITGKVAIPIRYERVGRFSGGLARARKDGKWGYIDHSGEWVIKPKYPWAEDFQDGLAVVWLDKWVGLINREGKVVIKTKIVATSF